MRGLAVLVERLATLVLLLAVWVGASGASHAAGVALVLEVQGTTAPPLQAFTEVPAGTAVSLSQGARLTFVHYRSCRVVSLVGGQVQFGAEAHQLVGGTVERDEKPRSCPKRVRAGGQAGGVLLRSGSPIPALSVRPTFVLVGVRADDFGTVRVSQGGQVVLEQRLEGRRFAWPGGTPALTPGVEGELALIPRASGSAPAAVKFRATSSESGQADDVPAVIAVD
jgi:hypothetical protein